MVFVAKLVRQLMGLLLSVNKVVGGRVAVRGLLNNLEGPN